MTRRKKPLNKTIVKEVLTEEAQREIKNVRLSHLKEDLVDFIFPIDLDKIQPDQVNGNLTIKFPE